MLIETLYEEHQERLKREYYTRNTKFSFLPQKIDVAIGVRRCGKTYFMYQTIDELLKKGTASESILYLNFEDDRLLPMNGKKAGELIDSFYTLFPQNHDRTSYLFLDEIQNIEGWAKLVRRLFDSKNVKLFLSGSSAKILSREIATELRGRSFATEIWPYSLQEFAQIQKVTLQNGIGGRKSQDYATGLLRDYMQQGGFPETLNVEDWQRRRILQDYVDVVVFRDIVERYRIANASLAKYLSRVLIRSIGRRFSINKTFNDLKSQGRKLSKDTLYELMNHFEDAYLMFQVPAYSTSERLRQTSPKKIYAVDMGLAAAYNINTQTDRGQLFENTLYLHLRRNYEEVFHYNTKNGNEVDFLVLDKTGQIQLYQACFDITEAATLEREQRALNEAQEELGVEGTLVTPAKFVQMEQVG